MPWIVYFCSLAWFVLILGGIWRAEAYEGSLARSMLGRLGVLAGAGRIAVEAIVLARLC